MRYSTEDLLGLKRGRRRRIASRIRTFEALENRILLAADFEVGRAIILAQEKVEIKKGSTILAGDDNNFADVIVNMQGGEIKFDKGVSTAQGVRLVGDRIQLDKDTSIPGDIFFNQLKDAGTIGRTLNTPLNVPIFTSDAWPEFHESVPGNQDIEVAQNASRTILPGDYGKIELSKNATLILDGNGIFNVEKIELDEGASLLLQATDKVQVRVADEINAKKDSRVGPAINASIDASSIVFYVSGGSAKFAKGGDIDATIYVHHGEIEFKESTNATGAFIAKQVKIEKDSTLRYDSYFAESQDTTDPTVLVLSPADGSLTNQNLTVAGIVSDDLSGVVLVEAQQDSGPLFPVTFDGAGNFGFDTMFPLDGGADGIHTVRLRATDQAGNVSSFSEVSFTLDTVAPSVTITGPEVGLLTNQNIGVTGIVSDSLSGVSTLRALVDTSSCMGPFEPNSGCFDMGFDAAGNYDFATAFPLDGSTDGSHFVRLQATDQAGNLSDFAQLSFTLDTTPPTIIGFVLAAESDTAPTGDLLTETEFVKLEGTTDPGQSVRLVAYSQSTVADANGKFVFTGVRLPIGNSVLLATATDAAGNVAVSSLPLTRTAVSSSLTLSETGGTFVERIVPFEVAGGQGQQTLRFKLQSNLGLRQGSALTGDILLVSVIDTTSGNGVSGYENLFSLNGKQADYPAGLVRYNNDEIEIDATELSGQTHLALRVRLLSGENQVSAVVALDIPTLEVDPEGTAGPRLTPKLTYGSVGGSVDVTRLIAATNVRARLSSLAFDSQTSQLTGQLTLVNNGPATGRQLFVFFPGLPTGVTLANASGSDAAGVPYLNLTPAIPSGGLSASASSLSVPVTFTTDLTGPLSIVADVRTAGPNQPPSLQPINDLVASIGATTSFQLTATDADGDSLTYSLKSTTRLPNVQLNSTGLVSVRPIPGSEGDYSFSVVVSDGVLRDEQQVNLSVALQTASNTIISGVVLDTQQNPIVGVPVQVGRFQSATDATGHFSLELPSFVTPTESFAIPVPTGDPQFDPFVTGKATIELRRAGYNPATGTAVGNPRLQPNLISGYLDGSVVYGSDSERATALRLLDGSGKLKTSPGDLLPFNNATNFPDGQLENENSSQRDPSELFAAGDVRANDNVALMALQTLMLREHNRKAEELATADPTLTEEQLYQQARRWVTALLQHITYQEYLPLLLGPTAIPAYSGYDPSVDPQISGLFSGAAFRIGHSMSPGELWRLGEDGSSLPGGPVSLGESFFNPDLIAQQGIEPFLLGMAQQPIEAVDSLLRDELRNFLFGPPGAGGLDLISLNIQRGRDLGLPSYNQARVDVGLPAAASFADISSDPAVQAKLALAYSSVEQVDVIVGGLAEDHVPGSLVGELFASILADQFIRSRNGDRFWYENEQFTTSELDAIRATTLADVILRNSSITTIGTNVFTTGAQAAGSGPGGTAALTSASEVRSLDGTGNNLTDPNVGAARQNLRVDYTLAYGDGISTPAGDDRPNARGISNQVFDQPTSQLDTSGATTMLMMWGQLLAHDMALTPGGTDDTLKIHGESVLGDTAYPYVAEKLPLMLGTEAYVGVNNVIARPIYLPALDIAGGTAINPSADTLVTQQVAPGESAAIFVQVGNLSTRQGQPFNGVLSVTEVPAALTPAALPDNLLPSLVVTIQPAEMIFSQPAPLSLPNRGGWPAGTIMDLWSINPQTGEFEKAGVSQVSADGAQVETISGGIRTSSWHFVVPPPPPPEVAPDPSREGENQNQTCAACEATRQATSSVELHSGAVIETHDLVSYQSLGIERGLTLRYDSQRADPRPIIHFSIDNAQGDDDRLLVARLAFTNGQITQQVPGFGGGMGLPGGEHFWSLPAGINDVKVALQGDLSGLPTGVYDYVLSRGFVRTSSTGSFSGSTAAATGQVVHVNAVDSPFGSGWQLGGIQQLVENPSGSILLVDGDGLSQVFLPLTGLAGQYDSPIGDYSTLIKNGDGTFTRTMKDQTVYQFDAVGHLVSMTDRNGNVTQHIYQAGRLTKIVDPVGLETLFGYSNGRISTITDPAGRSTRLQNDADGNLTRITDPDGAYRSFTYDDRHHILTEVDQLGQREETFYGFHGRASKSVRKDGGELLFEPVQTQLLLPASSTTDPLNAPIASLAAPTTIARNAEANGNVTVTQLDQFGQTVTTSDAVGFQTTISRDTGNQIASTETARGFATEFEYDQAGNLTSISDEIISQSTSAVVHYAAQILPNVGTDPQAIVAADLNNDGIEDLVVVNDDAQSISVWLGRSDFVFSKERRFPVGLSPRDLAVGDFNSDGRLDVAVCNYGSNDISLLLGNGDGSFQLQLRSPVGTRPEALAAGDFNGDSQPDLVVANSGSLDISILMGDGNGAFTPQVRFPLGSAPTDVTSGDFNLDGLDDVAVAIALTDSVAILFRTEGNTFTARQDIPVGDSPRSISAADLNADGALDIVTANLSRDISILLGSREGEFQGESRLPLGIIPQSISITDVDGDKLLDLAVANLGDSSVSVLRGMGGGLFAEDVRFPISGKARALAAADYNDDGIVDFAAAITDPDDYIEIVWGLGGGELATAHAYTAGTNAVSLLAGDFDGDGWEDLATVNLGSKDLSLIFNNGDATFSNEWRLRLDGTPRAAVTADFNGDDVLDFAIATSVDVSVLLGNGDRSFSDEVHYEVGSNPTALATTDLNQDGISDLVVTNSSSRTASVLLGVGNGTFSSQSNFPVGSSPQDIVAGDFNADGIQDFAVANSGSGSISILIGTGTGSLVPRGAFSTVSRAYRVAVADFDRDGFADLAVGSSPGAFGAVGELAVHKGLGDGTFATKQTILSGNTLKITSLSVIDLNEDDAPDLLVSYFQVGSILGSASTFLVVPNLGDATFADPLYYRAGVRPISPVSRDFDRDGSMDLAFANSTENAVSLLFGLATSNGSQAQSIHLTYDATLAALIDSTDELGRQTLYAIDPANGNRLSMTQVIGQIDAESGESDDLVTRYTYTTQGLLYQVTDPLGRITDFDYDVLGRLIAITEALGTPDEATQRLEYDAAGNVTAAVDANGNRTTYAYDAMNRLVRVAEPAGIPSDPQSAPITSFDYDERGNLTDTTDARGNTTRTLYDELDRPIRSTDADGNLTQFTYDGNGNVLQVIDPLGRVTANRYDARNRLIETVDPDGGKTAFRYDSDDNLIQLTDPKGNRSSFAHDARNRLVRQVDPLGEETLYAYDAVDNLVKRVDRNGRKIEFEYDDVDRMVTQTWIEANGSTANTVNWTYDAVGNATSISDEFSSLTFAYDARNRVLSEDNAGTPGAPQVLLQYAYDAVGNVLSAADASNSTATVNTAYAYDALNRLTRLTQTGEGVSDKRVDLAYNPLGQFAAIQRYADLAASRLVVGTSYTYDALNRLTELRHAGNAGDLAFYQFDFDAASQIVSIADVDGPTSFAYDNRGQLVTADRTNQADESYLYDETGNRVESHVHGDGYVTGDGNRLLSDGTYDYTYDAEGNLILRTEIATGAYREFTWDHRNRLTQVADYDATGIALQQVDYSYDALNRRIAKSVDTDPNDAVDAAILHFVYDREDVLSEWIDSDGDSGPAQAELSKRYLHGPGIDQVLAQEEAASSVQWLLGDHLGTIRDIVDSSGAVLNHRTYDAYGNLVAETDSTFSSRYAFTGREFDAEIELHYYRARYYDASTGSFISEDPIQFVAGDVNLYRYVGNDPVRSRDPSGLKEFIKPLLDPGDGAVGASEEDSKEPECTLAESLRKLLPRYRIDKENQEIDFGDFQIGILDENPLDQPGEIKSLEQYKNEPSGVVITIPLK